jgi:hypothetical protein
MKPVIPHKIASLIRKDGIAEITMRAWMETVTEMLEALNIDEGDGSPEGVKFASKKKLYFNTTGSSGSFIYIKTTAGDLNTGWVAIG